MHLEQRERVICSQNLAALSSAFLASCCCLSFFFFFFFSAFMRDIFENVSYLIIAFVLLTKPLKMRPGLGEMSVLGFFFEVSVKARYLSNW